MRTRLAACAAIILALSAGTLAACGKKEEETAKAPAPAPAPAMSGFVHEAGFDAAGYFMPANNIVINNYSLDHIAVGAPSDFSEWESGKREGVFGPIALQFEDIRSPTETNELGATTHTVRMRVLPTAYRFNRSDLVFEGTDPVVGKVRFEGKLDAKALSAATQDGSSGNEAVLLGSLTVGEHTISSQKFTFWIGD